MDSLLPAKVRVLVEALCTSSGELAPALREAIVARASTLCGVAASAPKVELAEAMARYVEKVALYAYRTTDEDIATLRKAGCSEDAIFEITISTALGAGLARLRRGLAAIEEAR